jgi:GT2 family glycosyltransferase
MISMRFSVIIPARPGTKNLKFLDNMNMFDYPLDDIEVIVAEGYQPSFQRNEAAKYANGEIIYFLDDDSEPIASLFSQAAKHYVNRDIAGVGGPAVAHRKESFWQQCFSSVLASPFGGFGISARYKPAGDFRPATEMDLILCNFSIKRDVFINSGGFDTRLYPNEENEFFNRLLSSGIKLFYDPGAIVYRYSRKNLADFFKQIFRYGRGRMEHLWIFPKSFKPFFFAPLFFFAYITILPHAAFRTGMSFAFFFPLYLYLLVNMIFSSLIAFTKRDIFFLPATFLSFFTLHIAYGVGSLYGIIRGFYLKFLHNTRQDKFRVTIKTIKPFQKED